MFNFKHLSLASLVFASSFAKQDSYLDQAKEYSQKTVNVVKDNAKKAKNYAKKHKIKTALAASAAAVLAAGSYGYSYTKKNDEQYFVTRLVYAVPAGFIAIVPDTLNFVTKKYKSFFKPEKKSWFKMFSTK